MLYTIDELREIVSPIAEKYRLKSVSLFGSYARGTATENSDVDLLIDTAGTDLDSLFRLGALYDELSRALRCEIDLVTVSSLEQPPIRESDAAFRKNVIRERRALYAVA